VEVHHPCVPIPRLQSLPYCNTIARPWGNIRHLTDPPFVCREPYSIGDGNIVGLTRVYNSPVVLVVEELVVVVVENSLVLVVLVESLDRVPRHEVGACRIEKNRKQVMIVSCSA